MKTFIKTHKFVLFLLIITIIIEISIFSVCFGMDESEKIDSSLGIVNTDYLHLRSGPGTQFSSLKLLSKNQYLKIFGKIGDWYIVQDDNNNIGTVHSKYITCTDELKSAVTNSETIKSVSEINMTTDEEYLLNLINNERKKNNLNEFIIDESLQNLAKLKAQDIVKNNYFSHISPTLGTPYEMLKTYNISYKTASENIAGNSSIDDAFSSFMNSDSHKNNILSSNYNYTGIAIVDSIAYGKIIVELFIEN